MALRRRGGRAARGHELFPGFSDIVEIGVGSLAVVFRAREQGTNRLVALKLLNVRDASPQSIESFERESIALGALSSHPNIVTLYRTFRAPDGRPVLVLELCTGAVADRIHDGSGVSVTDAVSIGIKIAGALETAHRAGILHRDVKPQNILVTEFGEPALADFGVAMLQSATQTTAGLFDFTTLHAAPELLEGGGTSAATDVYELASSLYQLIAGKSAFRAYEGESPASVILRILRDPVRPLSGMGVPIALSDLLIRAMSKQMDERPPTAAEFAAELAEIEIAQGWNRTQFLIRDPGPLGTGLAPAVTRMPDAVPRGLPSTLAPSRRVDPDAFARLHAQLQVEPARPSGEQSVPLPAPAPAPEADPAAQPEPDPAAQPEPDPAAQPEPEPTAARTMDWSQPTIVEGRGWTPPPVDAIAAAVPPTDTWWSAPPPNVPVNAPPIAASSAPAPPEPAAEPAAQPVPAPPSEPPPNRYQPPDWIRPRPAAEQPLAPATPAPAPPAAPRARRVPVDIDDDIFPARRPPGLDQPTTPVPAPPVPDRPPADQPLVAEPAAPPAPPAGTTDTDAVPIWAVRAPTPAAEFAGPQFSSDLSLDPMSLRPKLTIRAGASSVQVDREQLKLRTWLRRSRIDWADVHGFQSQAETVDDGFEDRPTGSGHLVALTSGGPVALPGTRRSMAELRYFHALLDAYRIRARWLANG